MSRTTGKFKVVENGHVAVDKISDDITNFMERIPFEVQKLESKEYQKYNSDYLQASIFTLGCFYRDQGVKFMSMYGSVTDGQVFSRELSVEEMVEVTSCRQFPQGDIISWDRDPWVLRSPWNRSKAEILDLEKDVCANHEKGYFLVPQQLSFDEGVHMCKKLSGSPISYTTKTEFEEIIHHLSLSSNMRAPGCVERLEDGSSSVQVWGGGSDEAREGTWTTWDTGREIKVGNIVY